MTAPRDIPLSFSLELVAEVCGVTTGGLLRMLRTLTSDLFISSALARKPFSCHDVS